MVGDELDKLESLSGIKKQDNETIVEYITRVGEYADIETEIVEGTCDYLTSMQFSQSSPVDNQYFKDFCSIISEQKDSEFNNPDISVDISPKSASSESEGLVQGSPKPDKPRNVQDSTRARERF